MVLGCWRSGLASLLVLIGAKRRGWHRPVGANYAAAKPDLIDTKKTAAAFQPPQFETKLNFPFGKFKSVRGLEDDLQGQLNLPRSSRLGDLGSRAERIGHRGAIGSLDETTARDVMVVSNVVLSQRWCQGRKLSLRQLQKEPADGACGGVPANGAVGGVRKFTWLRTLKNSARNSMAPCSPRNPSLVSLATEKSQLMTPGNRRSFRGELPCIQGQIDRTSAG